MANNQPTLAPKSETKLSEKAPLLTLKKLLDERLGRNGWKDLEPETILLEFNTEFSNLIFDKIMLLKMLEEAPNELMDSPLFFLVAVEVANNNVADFETVPHPTSLELAWGLDQFLKIMKLNGTPFMPGEGLIKTTGFLLRDDGFSTAVAPFSFLPSSEFIKGATSADMAAKATAVTQYMKHMEGVK